MSGSEVLWFIQDYLYLWVCFTQLPNIKSLPKYLCYNTSTWKMQLCRFKLKTVFSHPLVTAVPIFFSLLRICVDIIPVCTSRCFIFTMPGNKAMLAFSCGIPITCCIISHQKWSLTRSQKTKLLHHSKHMDVRPILFSKATFHSPI